LIIYWKKLGLKPSSIVGKTSFFPR